MFSASAATFAFLAGSEIRSCSSTSSRWGGTDRHAFLAHYRLGNIGHAMTPKQARAALLLGRGLSCRAVAQELRISERTITRYRAVPGFTEAERRAHNERVGEETGLRGVLDQALYAVKRDGSPDFHSVTQDVWHERFFQVERPNVLQGGLHVDCALPTLRGARLGELRLVDQPLSALLMRGELAAASFPAHSRDRKAEMGRCGLHRDEVVLSPPRSRHARSVLPSYLPTAQRRPTSRHPQLARVLARTPPIRREWAERGLS